MKTSIKSAVAVLALTALVAGPAASMTGQSVKGAVQSAVTEGNVSVFVKNGVATLIGWTDNDHTANRAKQAALSFDNVDSVVDLITQSR